MVEVPIIWFQVYLSCWKEVHYILMEVDSLICLDIITPRILLDSLQQPNEVFFPDLSSYESITLITDFIVLVHCPQTKIYDFYMLYLITYSLEIKTLTLLFFIIIWSEVPFSSSTSGFGMCYFSKRGIGSSILFISPLINPPFVNVLTIYLTNFSWKPNRKFLG